MSRGIIDTPFTGLLINRLVITVILHLDKSLIEVLRMNELRRNDARSWK